MGWVIGVVLNLLGSVCINGGTNLMKHGHNLREAQILRFRNNSSNTDDSEAQTTRSPTKSKGSNSFDALTDSTPPKSESEIPKPFIWFIGTFFFVSGSLLNFVSFGFAAQSLLAALGSAQFISNVFFGSVILGETVTRQTIYGTVVIIMGNAFVVYFSSHTSTVYTADDLISFYDLDFNCYAFSMLCVLLTCSYLYNNISSRVKLGELIPNSNLYLPLLYANFSAILGTQSVVQAKCLSILLRATTSGDNQLVNPFTYFVIFAWLAATSFWLTRMNTALGMFDGLFIIPVLQVFWTFYSIVSGGIYFEEFDSFSPGQMCGFCFGVFIVFVGVYMLSPGQGGDRDVQTGNRPSDSKESKKTEMLELNSPEAGPHRARGFSYDPEDPTTRMMSVWTTTTDPGVGQLLEKEPLRKLGGEVVEKIGDGAKKIVTAVRKDRSGSADSYNSDNGS
ncbi:hypothetical protein TrLO_g10003 [Triparma laevis f. longispina]|uniref:Magnesium transporter n=1 Tax=Triparma laevis f. longispina TaxID=1714387 RepID=A0A9W6ZQX5_9STRA|nr:hypothetical protein TrLO_g10003 [Triparma laevis f. longispina]